jgi:hypothetical protein
MYVRGGPRAPHRDLQDLLCISFLANSSLSDVAQDFPYVGVMIVAWFQETNVTKS